MAIRERVKALEQEVETLRADMTKLLRKAFESREKEQTELIVLRAEVARLTEERRAFTRFLSDKMDQMGRILATLNRRDQQSQNLTAFADAIQRIKPEPE
ncbi:MAG TPA: hypothetical protein VLA89_09320 [Gemmatimonadales bacterium]|nr:hypothetical protein [Gemmatimonadales bacterium]